MAEVGEGSSATTAGASSQSGSAVAAGENNIMGSCDDGGRVQEAAPSSSSSSPSPVYESLLAAGLKLLEGGTKDDGDNSARRQRSRILMTAVGVAFGAVVLSNRRTVLPWLLRTLFASLLQCVGVALGVGLGLGLATHVYDQLTTGFGGGWGGGFAERQGDASSSATASTTPELLQQQSQSSQPLRPRTLSSSMMRISTASNTASSNAESSVASAAADYEQSYASRMKAAGYSVVPLASKVLRGQVLRPDDAFFRRRGQVLRPDDAFFHRNYDCSDVGTVLAEEEALALALAAEESSSISKSRALNLLRQYWPVVSATVHRPLAKLIELVVRDYIQVWYSMVDYGCVYEEATRPPAVDAAGTTGSSSTENESKDEKGAEEGSTQKPTSSRSQQHQQQQQHPRRMIYSTARHLPLPFLERLYDGLAIAFGNLATRVEHVNLFELALIKWTRILAHQFKVYRSLRKTVLLRAASSSSSSNSGSQQKHQQRSTSSTARSSTTSATDADGNTTTASNNIPANLEIQMTKEFLFAGKLHRAITFGLDVPSLLFADGSGRECGRPNSEDADGPPIDDDALLEERLFGTPLLAECELDYNRVLANRMVRALLPRNDASSPLIASLVTEMLAGCVLTPLMSCFCPEYCNSWIIQGLGTTTAESSGSAEATATTTAEEGSGESIGENREAQQTRTGDEPPPSQTNGTSLAQQQQQHGREDPPSASLASSLKAVPEEKEEQFTATSTASCQAGDSQKASIAPTAPTSSMSVASSISQASDATPPLSPNRSPRTLLNVAPSPVPLSPQKNTTDIITLLALALIELQQFVDFEEIRDRREESSQAGEPQQAVNVDWDADSCREAILRLVLVLEAALTHGRCTYKVPPRSRSGSKKNKGGGTIDEDGVEAGDGTEEGMEEDSDGDGDGVGGSVEVTLPEYESTTLSQILMEMTSDLDAFEERVAKDNLDAFDGQLDTAEKYKDAYVEAYKPTSTEQSTLRTLIAAWLHTGQLFRTVTVLVQAHTTVLAPFYHSRAFLRNPANANGFVRQLKALDGVEVLVDTMAVLASPRLDEITGEELNALVRMSSKPSSAGSIGIQSLVVPGAPPLTGGGEVGSPTSSFTQFNMTTSASNPRYLDFHRNQAFASSLRSERERRRQSWEEITSSQAVDEEGLPIIYRSKGVSETDVAVHKELHHIARIFYSGTNLIAIRDAARHKTFDAGGSMSEASESSDAVHVSLLTVETASQRRRIEIPDDDSSFLLRAQPRPLNAVGVHRDQRNHDQSFKCYAGTYEEPALNTSTEHYAGGRYIRRCLVRFYPIDRTASVSLQTGSDARKMDQRKGRHAVPDTITVGQSSRGTPFLSSEFLRERHLCQRWVPKGTARSSILASSVMEPTDFNSMPRTGKALDFVFRMTFFERPMIDLSGKHFTVQDNASLGTHRADASSLEISDATLSVALLMQGGREAERLDEASETATRNNIEMGPDGYPVIWMKFSRKEEDGQVEVKPYRLSLVRAALLVTAARHEAQLQSLVDCVRSGSAKNATKALTDKRLQPTARLLEYAGNRSREKQSILLRDLKIGFNHIDREQLRRNGLLSPRYPTALRELSATVEDAVAVSDVQGVDLFGATGTVYKVRCVAVVDIEADDSELEGDLCYSAGEGAVFRTVREEWVVYRSFKDFQLLHKHVKMQVAASESSGTASSRLVGAAAAAFAAGSSVQERSRQKRGALIPSLSQASKAGALAATKKNIIKRKEALDAYLSYILSPGHYMNRCSEILLFIGASFPLPPEVRPGPVVSGVFDPLGRTEMTRTVIATRSERREGGDDVEEQTGTPDTPTSAGRSSAVSASMTSTTSDEEVNQGDPETGDQLRKSQSRKEPLIPAIHNKIIKVPLPLVRNRIFELLRYQFGFENASFLRNRMLAALKTVSFAVTSNSEFQKTLYRLHTEQLSADAVAGWIDFAIELIWPGGVFFESAPPTGPEQLESDSKRAKRVLHESFPAEVRAVLGQDLTRDGLDMFHEMLQNRVVVKSLFYTLFDLLWLEVFPEIGDVLECGAVLDIIDT